MEIVWTVLKLERRVSDGFVLSANWMVEGRDGDISSGFFNDTTYFDPSDSFTPYEQLTEAQVIQWIKEKTYVSRIESKLQEAINLKKSPITIIDTPPWVEIVINQ